MFRRLSISITTTMVVLFTSALASHAQLSTLSTTAYSYYGSLCSLPCPYQIFLIGDETGTCTPSDSLTIYINFGDGVDSTYKIPEDADGTLDSFMTTFLHTYSLAGTYTPFVTVTSATIADTPFIAPVTFSDTCANLSGFLYVDQNGNCIHDAGEPPVGGVFVNAINTTTSVVYTGYSYDGSYNIAVPVGATYNISTNEWWGDLTPSCPSSGVATVAMTSAGFNQDLGYVCGSTSPDLSVNAWASGMHPGATRHLQIGAVSNDFCDSVDATVTLTLDPILTYDSPYSGTAPSSVSGSTITWNVTSLSALNSFFSGVWLYCNPLAVLGDSACITVTISPVTGTDPNLSNNTYSVCIPINNSFDPNVKSVAPKGSGDAGNIPVTTSSLSYLVEFQNTGTDTAYNIMIGDQLDPSIDPASIHVISASAAFTTAMSNGLLKLRFNDIRLPDSNINEPLSHGYILFEAKLKPGLPLGTVIQNTADIYFDYNTAVITNTTTNTLVNPAGIQQLEQGGIKASVFPNPANNSLSVSVTGTTKYTVTLRDITGRIISVQNGSSNVNINTSTIPEGLYLIDIQSNDTELSTKILIRH